MPVAFDTMFLMTTDENMQKADVSLDTENVQLKDCFDAMNKALKYDEPEYIGLSAAQNPAALCVLLTEYTGYRLVDIDSKKVDIPKDFKTISDICRDLNALQSKYKDTMSKTYTQDYIGQIRNTVINLYNADPITQTKFMTEAYRQNEQMKVNLLCMPSYEGAGKYQAVIERSVCVNANTKNTNAAYQLVRFFMDYQTPLMEDSMSQHYSGIPISRTAVEKQMETAKTIGGKYLKGKDGMIKVNPLSDEYADTILSCF